MINNKIIVFIRWDTYLKFINFIFWILSYVYGHTLVQVMLQIKINLVVLCLALMSENLEIKLCLIEWKNVTSFD